MNRPLALLVTALAAFTLQAHAQTAAAPDAGSMVKTPPSSTAGNPDNMPVKRPKTPPHNDRMLHNSPASDAIAK